MAHPHALSNSASFVQPSCSNAITTAKRLPPHLTCCSRQPPACWHSPLLLPPHPSSRLGVELQPTVLGGELHLHILSLANGTLPHVISPKHRCLQVSLLTPQTISIRRLSN